MEVQFNPICDGTILIDGINLTYIPAVGEKIILEDIGCEFYVEALEDWHRGCISSVPDYQVVKRDLLVTSGHEIVILHIEPCDPENARPRIYITRTKEDKK